MILKVSLYSKHSLNRLSWAKRLGKPASSGFLKGAERTEVPHSEHLCSSSTPQSF